MRTLTRKTQQMSILLLRLQTVERVEDGEVAADRETMADVEEVGSSRPIKRPLQTLTPQKPEGELSNELRKSRQ